MSIETKELFKDILTKDQLDQGMENLVVDLAVFI